METNIIMAPENENSAQTDHAACILKTPSILVRNGYQYIELIGEGSNGKTYKSRNLQTGELVAIKALKFSENLKNYELFRREADVLKSLNTAGIPRYYDYLTEGDEFTECWLVQEFIEGKSLFDILESGRRFTEFETLLLIREVAMIVHELQTMYAPPIIHRDIKPSNILFKGNLGSHFEVHLIDFGAVANPQKRTGGSTVAGTVGYMAPEQLLGDCSIQSDYYALGATALHLMTGTAPSDFSSNGFNLQFDYILKSTIPDVHQATINLLHKLLAPKAQDRPKDANDLLEQINITLLSLYKSIDRKQQKIYQNSNSTNSVLKMIIDPIRLAIYAVSIFFSFFLIAGLLNGHAELIPVLLGIILVNIVITSVWNKVSSPSIQYEQPAPSISYDKLTEIENEIQKKTALALSGDNKSIQGTIVATYNDGVEFAFTINHITHVCFQRENKMQRTVGEKVNIKYKYQASKLYGHIVS